MKKLITIVLIVLVLTACAPIQKALTRAVIYYVSPNGSGTVCTESSPCALTTPSLSPGDILYLKSGTYMRSTVLNFSVSGLASSRIVISSAPGEHAVISGDVNGNNAVDETDGPRADGAHK